MPSTAPTLTWEMTTPRSSATPTSAQAALDALALVVGDVTRWEVKASAAGYCEVGPVAGSAVPNVRLLFAFGVNAAQVASPHSNVANVLYMGIAPDGGTLGDPFGAGNPYGAARWSGYWKVSGVTSGGDPVDQLFAIGSDEVLAVFFRETASEDYRCGFGGAVFDPPSDADGEGTPGRVYGMIVSGSDLIPNTFWSNANDFMSSGSGALDPQVGVFNPASPADWKILDRGINPTPGQGPRFTTVGGTRTSFPVPYHLLPADGAYYIGVPRQMRMTEDGRMRQIVQDGGGADRSYIVSGSSAADNDALSFDNG